jgi:putative membrane protein
MMWNYGMGTGVGGLVVVLLAVGAVVLIVVLLRSGRSDRTAGLGGQGGRALDPEPGTSHAEQILAERYSRGEIGADEYEERLGRLRGR